MADQVEVRVETLRYLIQAHITKEVGDKMGGLVRGLGEHTKDMPPDESEGARLMLLECVIEGFEIFCENTRQRIRNPSAKKFEITSRTGR